MSVRTELKRMDGALAKMTPPEGDVDAATVVGVEVRVFTDRSEKRSFIRVFVGTGDALGGRHAKADLLDYIWDDPLIDAELEQATALDAAGKLIAIVDHIVALAAT